MLDQDQVSLPLRQLHGAVGAAKAMRQWARQGIAKRTVNTAMDSPHASIQCTSRQILTSRIEIPKVCVTADDPRLTRGKPFPDPFLLAAKDLGVDPKRCAIFEDSPSGIKAAVAAGSTVIAVCTSHQRHKIDKFGAHFVCDTMEQIQVTQLENGELEFEVRQ